MKKLFSTGLALLIGITVIGSTSALAASPIIDHSMTPNNYDQYTAVDYIKDELGNVTYSNPDAYKTRTVENGTLTETLHYDIVNCSKMDLSGAYMKVNNIIKEDNTVDNVLYSYGPVNLEIYGGNLNYCNTRQITRCANFGVSNGKVLYARGYSDDKSVCYSSFIEKHQLQAGPGCEPNTETMTLTEPGIYNINFGTADCDIGFFGGPSIQLCILKGNEDMSEPASTVTATPTYTNICVDGSWFNCPAYTINDSNFIKLRDIAYMVSGTSKSFDVRYFTQPVEILGIMEYGHPAYKANGSEMAKISNKTVTAIRNTASFKSAFCHDTNPLVYTINGSNYISLRDIAQIVDFNVGYYDGTVYIDTSTGYQK